MKGAGRGGAWGHGTPGAPVRVLVLVLMLGGGVARVRGAHWQWK